jgi:hypothetical protein
MTPHELVAELTALGVSLEVRGGRLRASPKSRITTDLDAALRIQAKALVTLLEPSRTDSNEGCPSHWLHIPMLPPKGDKAITQTDDGQGLRYRVKLFGVWYLLRFAPHISADTVEVVCQACKRRMFASLDEFYRWAWSEKFHSELSYREVN